MSKVKADISMSLDGFVTGPHDDLDTPLGEGGERLHEWLFGLASWRARHGHEGGEQSVDADVLEEAFARTGAVLMGRRMFDLGERPWGDEPPFRMPVFVVTHQPREPLVKDGGTSFTFVTDGIERALALAREAAGERDVSVAGGADVIRQVIAAGLLDEIQLHVVPVLMGGGVRLFEGLDPADARFEQVRGIASPGVTHLLLRLVR
jgi:dihydrofolate reductase